MLLEVDVDFGQQCYVFEFDIVIFGGVQIVYVGVCIECIVVEIDVGDSVIVEEIFVVIVVVDVDQCDGWVNVD